MTTPSHLSLILDVSPQISQILPFHSLISSLQIFLNAHLSQHKDSQISVFSSTGNFLYPPAREVPPSSSVYPPFAIARESLLEALKDELEKEDLSCRLSAALSLSLAYSNKLGGESKILVICATEDVGTKYIGVMNAIFTAQKKRIPIDVVNMSPPAQMTFLQQAADATGGIYTLLKAPGMLLQNLIVWP
ncbi:RNA polymerase II transcription factor B subunit 4 [Neolecta irregularis DAH-3]|uniref:General transcription and DNA repair factor IIH subunit TFB4 n=1 Tax=Neolecta irregularis (strain DAH-3) TaxID=1198029 RepID=A0A1U7LWK8_NEOID|nr:RNA polymerase II transcription factor B subunit 4 [Neolecta irregularis DAH-3]|eukprot:OLL27065.1 RNA polymerase II transcription factor B subunit 4 [Neolecta irregularis DAH-3]